jgi:undecaprenyl-diphosphatase
MAVGMLSAAVFGLIAIKMVNWLVKSDKFKIFAYYTLALGILVTAAGIYEMFTDHALQKIVLTWLQ